MKKIILTLTTLILSIIGYSQPQMAPNTGVIAGMVIDVNNKPLEYVNVLVCKQTDSSVVDAVATDMEGKFMFNNLTYDNYYLEIKFLGFKNKKITNIIVSNDNRFVKIGQVILDPDDQAIDEVVVTGQVSNVSYQIDKKVINVSQDIQSQGGSASDALRNVPSVEVDVNGDVSLRGSTNFTVMINGKPSILDPNDALKQIPASNIEKIELITNPSAKYDPDGDAGIINIITKNKADNGLSGKIEVGADSYMGYNADILLSYKKNKIEIVTEIQANKNPRYMEISQYRATTLDTAFFYMNSNGTHGHSRSGMGAKLGINYFIDDNNTLTFNTDVGQREFANFSETNQETWWSIDENVRNYYNTASYMTVNGFMSNFDLNFDHKFNDNGHKIKAFAQYSYWEPQRTNLSTTETTDADWNSINGYTYQERTLEDISRTRLRFQLDYELPIGDKSKFEAGYAFRYLNSGGDYNVQTMDNTTNQWVSDDSRFNNMTLNRIIHAAYATFSGSLPVFDYQIGMRFEYTDRLVSEEATGTEYPIKRPDFFPTIHLSKKLPFDQQLQLSYSKRINRPHGHNLNPFPIYVDSYTIRQGNPGLAPEYTHSLELNYMKEIGKSRFSIETYYKQTDGKIDRFQEADGETLILITKNLNKEYSYGGEAMLNVLMFKFITLNIATNAYQYYLNGTLDGVDTTRESFTWNSRATLMAMLPSGTSIQIGAFYNAPTLTLDGQRQAMFMSNIGIRQSFMKRKLSLGINVWDPLNTMKFAFTTDTQVLYSENQFSSLRPTINVTLTYRINNYKQDKKGGNGGDSEVDFGGESVY